MIFEELERMDQALAGVAFGDLAALEALLPQRAALLHRIAGTAGTAEHEKILRRSRHACDTAIRQVCLARNLMVQEMALLTQEQRLWESIHGQLPLEESCSWSFQG